MDELSQQAGASRPLRGGWIKAHREILERVEYATLRDNLWRRQHELRLLIERDSDRGELPSLPEMAFRLRLPIEGLEGELSELVKRGLIVRAGERFSVQNYAIEQAADSVADRVARHRETKLERECNADVTKSSQNKNKNRQEEKENKTEASSPTGDEGMRENPKPRKAKLSLESDPDFTAFWEAYPVKVGKSEAFTEWQKAKLPAMEDILGAISAQKEWRASAAKGEFRAEWKHPSRWIKKECWDDQVAIIAEEVSEYANF